MDFPKAPRRALPKWPRASYGPRDVIRGFRSVPFDSFWIRRCLSLRMCASRKSVDSESRLLGRAGLRFFKDRQGETPNPRQGVRSRHARQTGDAPNMSITGDSPCRCDSVRNLIDSGLMRDLRNGSHGAPETRRRHMTTPPGARRDIAHRPEIGGRQRRSAERCSERTTAVPDVQTLAGTPPYRSQRRTLRLNGAVKMRIRD